jgi:23S rRNA (adenine2503-C2)-methyltransferase
LPIKITYITSLEVLTNPQIYNFGSRHISVSTCGIVPVIREFVDKFPQINLAISLHASNQVLREKLMPIAKSYPLSDLMTSLNYYLEKTNRKIFFEYILLFNENDSDKHAIELVNLLSDSFPNKLHLVHINLIVYNQTDTSLSPVSREKAEHFSQIL